jgi:hypothetical protein
LHKDLIAIKLGKKLKQWVVESMRSSLVYAMQSGNSLCISSKFSEINWSEDFNTDAFPTKEIFNFEEWHRYTNYMKIVKESENKNMNGDPGLYGMVADFKMVLLHSFHNEAVMERIIESVGDNIKHFRVLIIEKPEELDLSLHAKKAVREAGKACFMSEGERNYNAKI